MSILQMPDDVFLEIFNYLTYEEVAVNREVCRRFDQLGQQALNHGFTKTIKRHALIYRRIKSLLPRRESERRNHMLARHADILSSVETRLSMLSMTYTKYIEAKMCCFIPGRIIDEVLRILRMVSRMQIRLRPHEVLQELRDLSSMAMEHFDEKVAGNLRITEKKLPYYVPSAAASAAGAPVNAVAIDRNSLSGPSSSTGAFSGRYSPLFDNPPLVAQEVASVNICFDGGKLQTPGGAAAAAGVGGGVAGGQLGAHQMWNVVLSSAISAPGACQLSSCCGSIRKEIRSILQAGQVGLVEGINRHTGRQARHIDEPPLVPGGPPEAPPGQQSPPGDGDHVCPAAQSLKYVSTMYADGVKLFKHMQRRQKYLVRDLRTAMTTIREMGVQFGDLRKRFDDLDAKNRELAERLNQKTTDEAAAAAGSNAEAAAGADHAAGATPTNSPSHCNAADGGGSPPTKMLDSKKRKPPLTIKLPQEEDAGLLTPKKRKIC